MIFSHKGTKTMLRFFSHKGTKDTKDSNKISSFVSFVPLCEKIILVLLLCVSAASASEIRAVRFHTKPEHVFVNQPFELWFDVELPIGCEIQNLSFAELSKSSEAFSFGQFEMLPKVQRKVDDGKTTVDVMRFKSQALATVAGEVNIRARLQGMVTERTQRGFFSSSVSRLAQRVAEPFTLQILELPEEGKPANFSGAVGVLKLDAQLSSATAQPGDILTLTVSVTGDGHLRDIAMPVPRGAEGFRVYPLKEKTREAALLQSEQVFIPQTTNAVEIGAIHFSYFNPATRTYEEAVAGPFTITFTDAPVTAKVDSVRIIDTTASAGGGAVGQGVLLDAVKHGLQKQQATRTTNGRTEIRFAPSERSKVLFVLHPGTSVIPVETAGDWVRIDHAGRRGWLPSRMLKD